MKIIMTLSNNQIVRNCLFDKELDILRNLVYSEIILICSEATFNSVKKHVSSYSESDQLKIRILLFNNKYQLLKFLIKFLINLILNFAYSYYFKTRTPIMPLYHKSRRVKPKDLIINS